MGCCFEGGPTLPLPVTTLYTRRHRHTQTHTFRGCPPLARTGVVWAGPLSHTQAKLKDKMHGIKQKARRLSSELGAAASLASLRGAANPKTRRRHSIHVCDESESSQSQGRGQGEGEDNDNDDAGADAPDVESGALGGEGGGNLYKELLETERLRRREEGEEEAQDERGAPFRRRRASSVACLIS